MPVEREVAGLRRSRLRRGLVLRDSPVVVLLDLLASGSRSPCGSTQREPQARRHRDYILGGAYTGVLTSAGPIPVSVADIEWREAIRGRWKGQALAVSRAFYSQPRSCPLRRALVAADAIFERPLSRSSDSTSPRSSRTSLSSLLRLDLGRSALAGLMARAPHNFAIPRPRVLARHHRSRDCARSSGPTSSGIRRDPGPLPVRRRGARGRHGGPDLRRVRPARILRAGHRNRPLALLLLTAHWLRAETRAHERLSGACRHNGTLLFVVVASALQRMYLYQQEFGRPSYASTQQYSWSDLRRPPLVRPHRARARRDRFAFGALIAGFAAIFAINTMNLDALIASTNIDRMEDGRRFDAYYLTTLSADAVPVLVEFYSR